MSIVVEHDKRQKEILKKALDVFMEEGFENVTFQKIADRCGITRTTLYIYFKNKRDIFNFSIKQLLGMIEAEIVKIADDSTLTAGERLSRMMLVILNYLMKERDLLQVILNYLLHLAATGTSPNDRVQRRTLRLRHILAKVIIQGIEKGELVDVPVKSAVDMLYSLLESAVFRMAVLKRSSVKEQQETVLLAVQRLGSPPRG